MLFNYQEFLDGIDRKAYHEGEWQWEEDGYTVTRTYTYSAPGCHTSCGVLMYTKDGKLEKIEGDPLDPCANGRLCMRCLNLEEGVNYEDRPKYPLKRAGKRGENKWERITWDEALDTIADWIHTNIDEAGFGRESIFVNHGTGRNISSWVPFLGGACLGTPNIGAIGSSGYSCYLPRTCGTAASIGDFPIVDASEGHEDRYVNGEWVRPDVVVVWGCEPLKSNADGYLGHWLVACMQQGTEFVCIDPQLTWIAAHAMYWLPLRPATDMAVALSWLNVITQEDLHDADFVDKWCAYYDDLKDYVAQFTPEWASEVTGLDPDLIRESARFYAKAERGAIQWGLAFDTQNDSIQLCQTVSDIMSVCGNIDKPGTNLLVRNGFDINPGYATAQLYCPPETFAKKLTVDVVHPGYVHFIGMADCDAVNQAFETGKPYPMKMFWSQGANAITCTGNAAPRIYQMLENVEFCVVADPYLTPTAVAFADIFLPLKTTAERDSMRVWWTPLRAMKSVSQWYEAKSDEELIVALGQQDEPRPVPEALAHVGSPAAGLPGHRLQHLRPRDGQELQERRPLQGGHGGDRGRPHRVLEEAPRRRRLQLRRAGAEGRLRIRRLLRHLLQVREGALCAPTDRWDSPRRRAASSWCPTPRSAPGASTRGPSTTSPSIPTSGCTSPSSARSTRSSA